MILIIGRCSVLAEILPSIGHTDEGQCLFLHRADFILPTHWVHLDPLLEEVPRVTWMRATSYLSRLTGNGNAAIFVVFDRCPSLLHQGPVPGAGVKCRNSSPTCTNPLCKRALQVSNHHTIRSSLSTLLYMDTETFTDTVPLSRGLSF